MKYFLTVITTNFWLSGVNVNGYLYSLLINTPVITNSENNNSSDEILSQGPCSDSSDCPQDMFCDTHYGYCDYYRQEDENCRTDEQCLEEHICIFGKCQAPARRRHKGSRCQSNKDCRRNLCCARKHGEKICQSLIPKGHRCFVPDGGLEYSINEQCPCEPDLICGKVDNAKADHLSWELRSSMETVRCTEK